MLAIGCDHGGFTLKGSVIKYLNDNDIKFKDFGCFSEESVDYPDIALKLAEAVASGEYEKGIIICGTGIGVSIAANKVPGIRAALCSDTYSAKMSRQHNNANVLAFGGRVIGPGLAADIVDIWLKTSFLGDRHQRRIDKISCIEKKYSK